jgi:hypothetical protein
MTNQEQQPEPDPKSTTLNWNFSIGKMPQEMADAGSLEGRAQPVIPETGVSIELDRGKLRFGSGDRTLLQVDLNPEPDRIAYHDPFPLLTSIRNWLHRLAVLIAVALPIALVGLCVATGQAADTTFFAGVFGLILSVMLMSSFTPKRTVVSDLLEDVLMDAARKHTRKAPEPVPEAAADSSAEPATSETSPVFTIVCDRCGASFPPVPPRAICPHCSTPALPG